MASLIRDLRFSQRTLAKSPGFAAIAVVTLALGIGANTAIFSLVNAVMVRNLPVRNPGSLVLFADNPHENMSINEPVPGEALNAPTGQMSVFSYPLYQDLAQHSHVFQGICAVQTPEDTLSVRGSGSESGSVQAAQGKLVSGDFFSVLGVTAAVGRMLTSADDRPGAPPVAVVSFRYWKGKLGGRASIVGSAVELDGVPMTIVGIAPRGFFGVRMQARYADFWMPLSLRPRLTLTVMPGAKDLLSDPNIYWLNMIARLKPGVSRRAANAAVNVVLREYLTAQVGSKMSRRVRRQIEHAYVSLAPGGRGLSSMRFDYAEPLHILLAVVALVLLIACANVANLLLARSTARQKEMAMRLALGARRLELIRQMLIESALLAIFGAASGALLAFWCVRLLVSLVAAKVPLNVHPNLLVFAFTAIVSLVAVVLSGLVPAVKSSRIDLVPALKSASRSATAAHSRSRFGKGLVVGQIAISLVLLVSAGLLLRTLVNLEDQNLGFQPQHVLLASVDPELAGYKPGEMPGLYHELLSRIRALPGVRFASIGGTSPMSGGSMNADVAVEGMRRRPGKSNPELVPVGPEYFEAEGMRIIAGRAISSRDASGTAPVAVVDQAFVRRFLPKGNPLGQRFSLGSSFQAPGFQIVGVVENAKYDGASEGSPPMFFVSAYQIPAGQPESLLAYVSEIEIRTAGHGAAVIAEVRRTIREVTPGLPVTRVETLNNQVSDSLRQQRAISEVTGFFGILGLVLAAIGLYGILAYNVARRTSDIGIRMALGAERGDVLGMILKETLALIALGVAIGVPLALAGGRLVAAQLYAVKPADPLTVVGATAILGCVGLLAGYLPARRAANVDPMVALRYE